MDQFDKNIDDLYQENLNSIKVTRRQFYPRNFGLSEEFLSAFKVEYKRLLESGQRPKALLEKMNKALKFHL
tara:strand:- start:373 stop:585 length:213 start_codon:yes stop_codon:yes gene_type:complete